ncbi:hypothetical protein H9P43_001653 [Blastocladiella emersonii ATCC 22665]|nr:hypothetical protein H9P43_001653 [Blastocladiella emersonii ATCC 22665]
MTGVSKADKARADREKKLLKSRLPKSPRVGSDVLDIVTDDEYTLKSQVLRLVHSRLPHWEDWGSVLDPADIKLERISGAMTNCIFVVHGPPRKVSDTDSAVDAGSSLPSLDSLDPLDALPPLPEAVSSSVPTTDPRIVPSPRAPLSLSLRLATSSSYPLPRTNSCVPRRLLLRVYGVGMENYIKRDREIYWLRKLSETGYGPRLLATFANGRFEEYLDSITLSRHHLRDPATSRNIAEKVCDLHNLADQFPVSPGIAEERASDPELWTSVKKYLAMAVQSVDAIVETYPDRADRIAKLGLPALDALIARARACIEHVGSPIVFAHNDLQYGNILKHSMTDEIIIVDYEYSSFNYRGFDIANHFCEWMADYHGDAPHVLTPAAFPTRAERDTFYRAYIAAHERQFGVLPPIFPRPAAAANGTSNGLAAPKSPQSPKTGFFGATAVPLPPTPADRDAVAEALEREVRVGVLLTHVFWGLWGLVREADMLGRREIDFDYWEYGAARIERFRDELDAVCADLMMG